MPEKKPFLQPFVYLTLLLLLFGGLAQLVWGSPEAAFNVNVQNDGVDANIGDGICDADGGSPGSQCTLRAAIQEANATPAEDTVNLPAGTYILTIPGGNEDNAATGDLDVTAPLTLSGAGAASTIIDGNGNVTGDRIFDLYGDALISGVTIRNGKAPFGGGVSSTAGVTLSGSIITANEATNDSGGIFNGGTMTLAGSLVSDNISGVTAGGVYNVHRLTVINSTISGNSAGGDAGGVYNLFLTSIITVTNSTLSNNEAASGGAIYNNGGQVTVTGTTMNGNKALSLHGGALYNKGTLILTNSTLSSNRAVSFGGGLFNEPAGTTELSSVTIAYNEADENSDDIGDGGGVYNNGGAVRLRNSLLYDNEDGELIFDAKDDCGGTLTSFGFNWIGTLRTCTLTAGTADIIGLNPQLGPLQNNGGSVQTHALMPGSPAIDSGPSTFCRTHLGVVLLQDQRGFNRHVDGNNNGTNYCDPGAFEFSISYTSFIPMIIR